MPIFLSERHYDPNATVVNYRIPNENYSIYDIFFYHDRIHTEVTSDPSYVDSWISKTLRNNPRRRRSLTVGLDIEWRPNFGRRIDNPVATLQLSVIGSCLVFQILHAPYIPSSLTNFLSNPNHTFVGVGIGGDVDKLRDHYSLDVASFVDLRDLAADVLRYPAMRSASLKTLASHVLGVDVEKPRRITLSRWDSPWLDVEQVEYAAVDAFVSFEIGRSLFSR